MNRSTTGKNPLISDWFREVVCLPQWEKYPKPIRENPLTDVNLAIVCRTILAPTPLIPARATKELLKVVPSHSLSFLAESFLLFFFSKKLAMFSVFSFKKCSGLNRSETGKKTLINTAWPLTSQTRAYQQDLETTTETTLTCLRFEHRKRNWEKNRINTGWSLNGQKCVYQRALGMASTIESEIGKNP